MTDQTPKPGSRPRRLGRGLAALVDEASSAVRESQAAMARPTPPAEVLTGGRPEPVDPPEGDDAPAGDGSNGSFVRVLIGSVAASPFQPREAVDEAALDELADSVRRSGVIQPIVVRRSGEGYELIAGERRWRAAQRAGLEHVPAVVRDVDDRTAAEWALVENVQRRDLNPVERARAFRRLVDEFGLTHGEIAQTAGIKRPTVANTIRLLDLGDDLLALVASGALSAGHAKVLLSVPDTTRRSELGVRCAHEEWSVRRLEEEVGNKQSGGAESGGAPTPNNPGAPAHGSVALRDLERRIGEHLGTRARLKTSASGEKGSLSVEFYGLDHFEDLLSRLGMNNLPD
ncbi:MAG: chromosome partitioning protein ParB [Phycisphaeraceae bacterium]|nr:MAG: chromosome partitioning protein ParB [Phycisphaeraceae bacterium]